MIPYKFKIPEYARYAWRIKTRGHENISKRIVLLSDTHISTAQNSLFNRMMFRKGISEIKKIPNVDYIIHLGDLTHEGTLLEYEIAEDLMRSLRDDRFFIIPGNHDSRNVGYMLFEEIFGERTFKIDDGNLFLLGIDSSIPDQDAGHIGKRAIRKCEELFQEHQDQVNIFCFHHQLIPIPYTGRERSAIFDGGDVLEMILKKNVDIVLNGHRHITNIYSTTDGDKDLVIFNCGTLSCNKTRYKEQYSYSVLDIGEGVAKFTTKLLMEGSSIERQRYYDSYFSIETPVEDVKPIVSFVHIGNTHFSKSNYNDMLYAKSASVINELNPDAIIHTGSVTFSNLEDEYDLAVEKLKLLNSPLIILPGMKDLRKYEWDLFSIKIGDQDPYKEFEKFRILGINTIDPHISNGTVGRRRLRETIKFFKNCTPDKLNIIALNHRLIPPPKLKFDFILTDSGNVLSGLTNLDTNVNLILMGKNNSNFALQVEDTVLSYCGSLSSKDTVEFKKHTFNYIKIFVNGYVQIDEYTSETNSFKTIGRFWIKPLEK